MIFKYTGSLQMDRGLPLGNLCSGSLGCRGNTVPGRHPRYHCKIKDYPTGNAAAEVLRFAIIAEVLIWVLKCRTKFRSTSYNRGLRPHNLKRKFHLSADVFHALTQLQQGVEANDIALPYSQNRPWNCLHWFHLVLDSAPNQPDRKPN